MTEQTQAFLSEAKAPTIQPHAQTRAAIAAYITEAGDLQQQVSLWLRMLDAADLAEPDESVRQHFHAIRRKLEALRREMGNAEKANRLVVACIRELGPLDAQLRQMAKEAGYVV